MGLDAPSSDLTARIKQRRAEMMRDGTLNGERNPQVEYRAQGRSVDLSQLDAVERATALRARRSERSQTVVEFEYTPEELEAMQAAQEAKGDTEDGGFNLTDEDTDRFDGDERDLDLDAPDVKGTETRRYEGVSIEEILELLARIEPYLAAYELVAERLGEIERVLDGHGKGLVLLGNAMGVLPTAERIEELISEYAYVPPPTPPSVRPWYRRLLSFIYSPA